MQKIGSFSILRSMQFGLNRIKVCCTPRYKRRGRVNRSQAGFSLLELLIVIAILALLATLVGPRLVGFFSKAKSQTAQIQISNIASAVELYFLDVGTYPPQDTGLAALIERPQASKIWNGPYLKKKSGIIDPWGRPYIYHYPGKNGDFDIMSLGRDAQKGGTEENKDLGNW